MKTFEKIISFGKNRVIGSITNGKISYTFALDKDNNKLYIIDNYGDIILKKENIEQSEMKSYILSHYPDSDVNFIKKNNHFDEKLTTDTFLVKEKNGIKKLALITRSAEPFGRALPGGRVEEGLDSFTSNIQELADKTNIVSYKVLKDVGTLNCFEIRGSCLTHLLIVEAINPKEVSAGVDTLKLEWFSKNDILSLVDAGCIIPSPCHLILENLEYLD